MNYIKNISSQDESPLSIVQQNIVGGYYGSDTVDVDGHIIFQEDYVAKMIEYAEWGNVRNNHKEPVGTLHAYNPDNWNYFEVQIPDATVMEQVRNHVLKGFSIGIKADEHGLMRVPLSQIPPEKYEHLPAAVIKKLKRLGYVIRIKDFYIFEISITDRPKNTQARITFHKSEDGGDDVPMPTLEDLTMENEQTSVEVTHADAVIENTEQNVETNQPVVDEATIDKSESAEVVDASTENETVSPNADEEVSNVEVTKSDAVEVETEDASMNLLKSFEALTEKFDALAILVKEIGEKIEKGVSVESPTVEVSKSETMEALPTPAFDVEELKSFISQTVNDAVERIDISNVERLGTVNKGETEEVVETFNVATMDKTQAYATIADIVARRLKS